jgi:hypothetical protein
VCPDVKTLVIPLHVTVLLVDLWSFIGRKVPRIRHISNSDGKQQIESSKIRDEAGSEVGEHGVQPHYDKSNTSSRTHANQLTFSRFPIV